jgi:hypothetical protein
VRNSEGTEAHSGTRFGGLGRVRVESTMSRTVSNEGSMLVFVGERSAWIWVVAVAGKSYFGCHGGNLCYATGRGEVTKTKLLMGVRSV